MYKIQWIKMHGKTVKFNHLISHKHLASSPRNSNKSGKNYELYDIYGHLQKMEKKKWWAMS